MSERVFIGNDGATFKLRVALPGEAARTAALDRLSLHENMEVMYPFESGYQTVAAGGSVNVTLTRSYTTNPFIILRCAQNIVPCPFAYFASLKYDTRILTLTNNLNISLDMRYAIFGATAGQGEPT